MVTSTYKYGINSGAHNDSAPNTSYYRLLQFKLATSIFLYYIMYLTKHFSSSQSIHNHCSGLFHRHKHLGIQCNQFTSFSVVCMHAEPLSSQYITYSTKKLIYNPTYLKALLNLWQSQQSRQFLKHVLKETAPEMTTFYHQAVPTCWSLRTG
jgi:hypothetical protein